MIMDLLDQSTPPPLSAPMHCKDMAASDDVIPSSPGQPARTAMDDEGSYEPGVSERWPVSTLRRQERGTIPPYQREPPPATGLPEARPATSDPIQGDIR
jgi:hypothetical protein